MAIRNFSEVLGWSRNDAHTASCHDDRATRWEFKSRMDSRKPNIELYAREKPGRDRVSLYDCAWDGDFRCNLYRQGSWRAHWMRGDRMDVRYILAVPDQSYFGENAAYEFDTLVSRRKREPGLVDRFGRS